MTHSTWSQPMAQTDHEQLQEVIGLALGRRRGKAEGAHALADTAVAIFQEIEARLSPVIGTRGVEVLLGRALHLTSASFPWLDLAPERGDFGAPVSALHQRLAARDAKEAFEGSLALLMTFTELLSTLIGTPLTRRLLTSVWAAPAQEKPHD
jgi:hypothetical protein